MPTYANLFAPGFQYAKTFFIQLACLHCTVCLCVAAQLGRIAGWPQVDNVAALKGDPQAIRQVDMRNLPIVREILANRRWIGCQLGDMPSTDVGGKRL